MFFLSLARALFLSLSVFVVFKFALTLAGLSRPCNLEFFFREEPLGRERKGMLPNNKS